VNLDALAIAVQGIGYSERLAAMQGLFGVSGEADVSEVGGALFARRRRLGRLVPIVISGPARRHRRARDDEFFASQIVSP